MRIKFSNIYHFSQEGRRLLPSILFILFAINCFGETVTIVKNSATEYISSHFEGTSKYWVTELKIVGELNGRDAKFIKEIASSENNGNLTKLDLSEASFVDVDGLEDIFEGLETNKTLSSSSIYNGLRYNYHDVYKKFSGGYDEQYDTYYFGYHIVWKDIYPGYYQFKIIKKEKIDIKSICSHFFEVCDKLTSIVMPSNTTGIGNYAFSKCVNLNDINVPDGIEFIGDYAFQNCSALSSFIFPPSLSSIGSYAYAGCTHITSVDLSFTKKLSSYCFKDCTNLVSAKLCNNMTTIPFGAFDNCKKLSKVNIPDETETINTYAFQKCGLEELIIPAKVTSIGSNAFDGNPLKKVYSLSQVPCHCDTKPFFQSGEGRTLYVPKGCVERYSLSPGWCEFGSIVEMSEGDVLPQCPSPTIAYVDGQIIFSSSLPSANYHYTISTPDSKTGSSQNAISLAGYYNILYYSSSDGYRDSETINAKLFWINGTLDDASGIRAAIAPQRAMIASFRNGFIELSGLNEKEEVSIYSLNGVELYKHIASNGVVHYYSDEKIVLIKVSNTTIKLMNQ